MYDTVESTVQFCLQKPNVHNSTLLKNTYEVSLIQRAWGVHWFAHVAMTFFYLFPLGEGKNSNLLNN